MKPKTDKCLMELLDSVLFSLSVQEFFSLIALASCLIISEVFVFVCSWNVVQNASDPY